MNYCATARNCFILILGAATLLITGCGDQPASTPATSSGVSKPAAVAKGAEIATLPSKGKLSAAKAPAIALFGMIYIDTTENREYIFDGKQWVPHDKGVDSFYGKSSTEKVVAYPGGPYSAGHNKHTVFDCQNCHKTYPPNNYILFFQEPSSLARITPTLDNPNPPAPVYNGNMFAPATPKTCSNIACHGIARGTFNYYFIGGDGEPELKAVEYGGSYPLTPEWNTTTTGCKTCHGNPPNTGSWHSGYHGGQGPSGSYNQCQFCHPDATGSNGVGTAITFPELHANGTVNIQAVFKSSCFGCH